VSARFRRFLCVGRVVLLVGLVAGVGCLGLAENASGFVYWTNPSTGAIGRANLDGSGANPRFITGAGDPEDLAVDARHIYWGNSGLTSDLSSVGRANLDGSGVNPGFIPDAGGGVAVDGSHVWWGVGAAGGGWVYWITGGGDYGGAPIGRANLDGSGVDRHFIQDSPPDFVHIARANTDGSHVDEQFVSLAAATPGFNSLTSFGGLAVDASHVYWTDATYTERCSVSRSALRGPLAGRGQLIYDKESFECSLIGGVAVDRKHVYWDTPFGFVGRVNLDGSQPTPQFLRIVNHRRISAVAVDAIPGPILTKLRISPRAFAAARSGPAIQRPRRGHGATVHYTLAMSSSVAFRIARALPGRRVKGHRCAAPKSNNRNAARCTRWVRLPGGFARPGKAGTNTLGLAGRLKGKELKPATYRLVATPSADQSTGRSVRATFHVIP
jgi:hypothetical protein